MVRWKDYWVSEQRAQLLELTATAEEAEGEATGRLRLGYISRRIEDYAGTHLMLPVYSSHNRSVVSVHVFARGTDDGSTHRAAVAYAADSFADLSALTTAAAAEAIRGSG